MPTAATIDTTTALDDRLIIARAVARRLGVCTRTLERWIKADHIGFPKPDLVTRDVAGRPANRFWRLSTLVTWESRNIRPTPGRPAVETEAA